MTTYIKLGTGTVFQDSSLGIYLNRYNAYEIDDSLLRGILKSFIDTGYLIEIPKRDFDKIKVQKAPSIFAEVPTGDPVLGVKSTPPDNSPTGSRFIVGSNAQDEFSGKDTYIAQFVNESYQFQRPTHGLVIPSRELGRGLIYQGSYPSGIWVYTDEGGEQSIVATAIAEQSVTATRYIKLGKGKGLFADSSISLYLNEYNAAEVEGEILNTVLKEFLKTGDLIEIDKSEFDNIKTLNSVGSKIPTVSPVSSSNHINPAERIISRLPEDSQGGIFLVDEVTNSELEDFENQILIISNNQINFVKPQDGMYLPVYNVGKILLYQGSYPSGRWTNRPLVSVIDEPVNELEPERTEWDNIRDQINQEIADLRDEVANINLRRAYLNIDEMLELAFDPEGNYFTERIKPLVVETTALVVGTRSQRFSLINITFDPNTGGNPTVFTSTRGLLTHLTIDDLPREWFIPETMYSQLEEASPYYMYARCDRGGQMGFIVLSKIERVYDADSQYYYFYLGILHSAVDGVRGISLSYGQTKINGAFINTGVVASQDGSTYFNLDKGEIGGRIRFTGRNGASYAMETYQDIIDRSELVTDFFETTIDGNLIFTAALIVGDPQLGRANAGVSGISDQGAQSVRLYAGSTLANRNTAPFRVLDDGTVIATKAIIQGTVRNEDGKTIEEIAEEYADAIKVGARNFAIGTVGTRTLSWTGGNNEVKFLFAVKALYYNEPMTVHFDYVVTNTQPFVSGSRFGLNIQSTQVGGYIHGLMPQALTITEANKSGHYVVTQTFSLPSGVTPGQLLYIHMYTYAITGTIGITNFKLESGNKETDWIPAPEDIDAEFANVRNDIIQIDETLQDVEELANLVDSKTQFLTFITDQLVASGTMLVGNSSGVNAGLTGVGTGDANVFLFGGSSFQNRDTAPIRLYRDGRAFFENAYISGTIEASDGLIGGFKINLGSLETAPGQTYDGGRFVLYPSNGFIAFINETKGRWAGLGQNVFPASTGVAAVGRFENTETNVGSSNYGIYLDVAGATNNIALYIDSGQITNINLRAQQVSGDYTFTRHTIWLSVYNSEHCTITLPAAPEWGKIVFIKRMNTAGITISTQDGIAIYSRSNVGTFYTPTSWLQGDTAIMVYDGQFWCYHYLFRDQI